MLNIRSVATLAVLALMLGPYSCGKREEPAPPPPPPAPAAAAPAEPARPPSDEASTGAPSDAAPDKSRAALPENKEERQSEPQALERRRPLPLDRRPAARGRPSVPSELPEPAIGLPSEPTGPRAIEKSASRQVPDSTADAFSTIDNALKETGSIAFNAPKTMNLKETVKIQLLLSLAKSMERLKQELSEGSGVVGEQKGATVKVAPIMEARLSGPNFEIVAVTPEEQMISREANTEWQWEVKARESGKQNLHLTLTAIVGSSKRAIRTFDEVITVEVTATQRLTNFVQNNWQWLWAVIVAPALPVIWKRRKKAKSRKR